MEARLREVEAALSKRATFDAAARRLAGELRGCDAAALTKPERTVRARNAHQLAAQTHGISPALCTAARRRRA